MMNRRDSLAVTAAVAAGLAAGPTTQWARCGRTGSASTTCHPALVRAYADDPHKPVWLAEYGTIPDRMPAADLPAFLIRATTVAIDGGVSLYTVWCSHDVDRAYTFPPVE